MSLMILCNIWLAVTPTGQPWPERPRTAEDTGLPNPGKELNSRVHSPSGEAPLRSLLSLTAREWVCSPWLVHSQPFCISDPQNNSWNPATPHSPAGSQQRSLACGSAAEASRLCQKKNINCLKLSCPEGPWVLIKFLSGNNWRIPARWPCNKEDSERRGHHTSPQWSMCQHPTGDTGTALLKGATAEVRAEGLLSSSAFLYLLTTGVPSLGSSKKTCLPRVVP